MDDALPPLPRPLVPTHSRSFSSSSSSSSSSAASLERDPEASAADPRWWNDAQSASPSRQQLAVDSAGLDGTSPPLGMLADDQPFADSFLTAHRSGSADDDDDDEPDSRQDLSRSAISAADLDFPRSSTSPHSQAGHHSLLSRDSPNPISASPAPNRSSSDTSIASPVEQQKQTTLRRAPRASDDEFSYKPEPQTGGLPASASVASDLGGGGTFRRRAPFASAAAAAEEDRVLDDGDETSVGAAATAAAPLDETLLRRRKYRARGSYTPSTPVSPDGMASGTSADLSARSRRILDEMNSRGGGGGGGVASSSAIQDPALRRTATVETLRGARTASRAGSTTVDEFGSVSGGAGSQTVPRSRTTNDLLLDGDTDPQRSDTGRSLGRSASTTASTSTSSRTYGYRSGSRAAQVLASIRPSTAASPYYDPSPATTTGRMSRTRPSNHHHENGALPPPPPLPTSTSMYQLRSAPPVRDRASTALDTTEARDRDSGRWGYHVSPQGAEDAVRTRRTPLSVERNSRELLFGARRRGGAEEQEDYASSSPRHVVAGRAATSLGTASLTRRQRDHPLGARSFSDNDDDGDEKASGHHFDHRRSIVRAGTSLGTPNRSRRNIGLAELSNAAKSRRQVNGSEQFSSVAGRTVDDMLDDESELERTPRSGKKSSGGTAIPSTGSHDNVPRALYPDLYAARSPPLAAEAVSRSTGTRSIRRERSVTGSESGSEAWLAEAERARHRTNKSRATGGGSSDDGDAASVVTTRTQADVDRDRTVRAINDLLREQGIVAAVASDSFSVASRTSSSSSPRKRDSVNGGLANRSDLPPSRAASHRLAIGRDSPAALPASRSMHNDLSRRSSMVSVAPGRPETALRGLIDRAGPSAAEHHTLLFAALDQFDKHFTEAAQREGGPTAPTSPASAVAFSPAIDLVKRTDGLVNSTTRLNTGLRGLLEAIKSDQVEAQLAEDGEPRRSSPLAHFERSVNALLRISEDQVRSLTEDLVAVIRFDRDRTHVATSGVAVDNRPTSRASTYRSSLAGSAVRSGDFIQSPPRRATTASPYEGSTVSHASVRSPTAIRQTLRDPLLDEQSPSSRVSSQLAFQRHTVGYAGGTPSPRSSLAQMGGTPSPAARRESVHARSPLSDVAAAYETPSRVSSLRRRRAANSIVASASYSGPNGLTGLSLPLPRSEPNSEDQPRRSKTSDTTVRPSSPTQTRVSGAAYPVTSVDSTQATTQSSPTHPSAGFEVASQAHDRDLPDLPQTSPVVGPQRFPTTGTEGLRPTISATSAMTLPVESPTSSRKRSIRLSGGIGAAIKNAFTSGSRKPASEGVVQNSSSASKTASPPLLPALPGSVSTIPLERTSSRASGLEERRRDSQRLSRRD